jgi:hypothetical protein
VDGQGADNFDRCQRHDNHECYGLPERADRTPSAKGVDGAPPHRNAAAVAIDWLKKRDAANGVWSCDDCVPLIDVAAAPYLHLLPAREEPRLQELYVMPGAAARERRGGECENPESSARACFHGQGRSGVRAA